MRIHRTKGLRWSLGRWKSRSNELPDPDRLWQPLPCDTRGDIILSANLGSGAWQSAAVAKLYLKHMRCVVFRDEIDDIAAMAAEQRAQYATAY